MHTIRLALPSFGCENAARPADLPSAAKWINYRLRNGRSLFVVI